MSNLQADYSISSKVHSRSSRNKKLNHHSSPKQVNKYFSFYGNNIANPLFQQNENDEYDDDSNNDNTVPMKMNSSSLLLQSLFTINDDTKTTTSSFSSNLNSIPTDSQSQSITVIENKGVYIHLIWPYPYKLFSSINYLVLDSILSAYPDSNIRLLDTTYTDIYIHNSNNEYIENPYLSSDNYNSNYKKPSEQYGFQYNQFQKYSKLGYDIKYVTSDINNNISSSSISSSSSSNNPNSNIHMDITGNRHVETVYNIGQKIAKSYSDNWLYKRQEYIQVLINSLTSTTLLTSPQARILNNNNNIANIESFNTIIEKSSTSIHVNKTIKAHRKAAKQKLKLIHQLKSPIYPYHVTMFIALIQLWKHGGIFTDFTYLLQLPIISKKTGRKLRQKSKSTTMDINTSTSNNATNDINMLKNDTSGNLLTEVSE